MGKGNVLRSLLLFRFLFLQLSLVFFLVRVCRCGLHNLVQHTNKYHNAQLLKIPHNIKKHTLNIYQNRYLFRLIRHLETNWAVFSLFTLKKKCRIPVLLKNSLSNSYKINQLGVFRSLIDIDHIHIHDVN